jgi:hypothetical protein
MHSFYFGQKIKCFTNSIVDRHHVDADPDPDLTFHFDADPDPDMDMDWHQNKTKQYLKF